LNTEESKSLFVGNLPFDMDEERMTEIFAKFGKVESCYLPKSKQNAECKGFGFVTFEDRLDAVEAHSKMKGASVYGKSEANKRLIRVDFDAGKKKKEDAGFLKIKEDDADASVEGGSGGGAAEASPKREARRRSRSRSRSRSPSGSRSPSRSKSRSKSPADADDDADE